jgi:hypothetical protein
MLLMPSLLAILGHTAIIWVVSGVMHGLDPAPPRSTSKGSLAQPEELHCLVWPAPLHTSNFLV